MSNKKNVTISDFYCVRCGRKGLSLPRKVGQQRPAGHLKSMYCPTCQKVVNHVEVRPFGTYTVEDFKLEFELGRFLDSGLRVEVKDLEPCKCTKCRCNINGKCWNSNGNYKAECKAIIAAYAAKDDELVNRLTGWKEE